MAYPPEDDHSNSWLVKMVELAKARDQGAFAALFERYNSEVCILLSRLLNSREEIHNLASDTFLKAWLHLPELQDTSRFRAWLYIIATNTGAFHFFAPSACLSMRGEKVCLPQRYCASVRPVF